MVGPELLKRARRGVDACASSPSPSSSLTVCTHAGYFDDFKPARLRYVRRLQRRFTHRQIGEPPSPLASTRTSRADTQRRFPPRPTRASRRALLRPPPFWASDYNEEAATPVSSARAVVTERLAELPLLACLSSPSTSTCSVRLVPTHVRDSDDIERSLSPRCLTALACQSVASVTSCSPPDSAKSKIQKSATNVRSSSRAGHVDARRRPPAEEETLTE